MSIKHINILPLALERNQNPHFRVNMISLNFSGVYVPELVIESHNQMVIIATYHFPFMLLLCVCIFTLAFSIVFLTIQDTADIQCIH